MLEDERDFGALGRLIAQGRREAEGRLCTAWRDALEQVLIAGGVAEDHAAWALVREHDVDVNDGAALMAVSAGALGPCTRHAAETLAIWQDLQAAWESAADAEEHWDAFHEAVADSQPMVPDDAVAKLSTFAAEVEDAQGGTWPLVHLGVSEGELVGAALHQLSERSGTPRDLLPNAPCLEGPAMALTEAATAVWTLADWIATCEARARVLARLGLGR